ncbi:MAG: cation diffusion facilitator family transporter [Bacteroidales bacterium]|jgi:cobalt-zinc-cadmium efflux system protein|nr:cation diffusion facilitator family transporter [Bacteroidales bacterium]
MENHHKHSQDHDHDSHHGHGHSHGHHHHGSSNIKIAFFLNLSFSIIEVVGGFLTNSVAILSDALHDLGDSFSLALAWYFQKVSKKKSDAKYSYGYRRFSLLGALINSVILLLGSFFVISESIQRIASPEETNAKGMLLLAIFGIVINGAAMLRLKKGSSLNERAVSLHMLEDVLGWVAVLIGSIVMIFADVPILDPILSLIIACYILFNIYRNLRDTLRVILQGTPENIDGEEVKYTITNIDGVQSLHDLHMWSIDGEFNILTVHVVVDPALNNTQVVQLKCRIKEVLLGMNIQHSTLEMEQPDEECAVGENCSL